MESGKKAERLYFGSIVNCPDKTSRRNTISLDGKWDFELDPGNTGSYEKLASKNLRDNINVPGAIQAQGYGGHQPHFISQVGHPPLQVERTAYSGTAWYRKNFSIPGGLKGKQAWLKFGGIQPEAEIWFNGTYLGNSPGSFCSFKFNVTDIARWGGDNSCVLHVFGAKPWNGISTEGGIYTFAAIWSGIYRSVELEYTEPAWIERTALFPSLKQGNVKIRVDIMKKNQGRKNLEISFSFSSQSGINAIHKQKISFIGGQKSITDTVKLKNIMPWSLDNPCLTYAEVTLSEGSNVIDSQKTRFGMRDLDVKGRHILLNGSPVYIRGFGYHHISPRTLSPDLDPKWITKQIRRAKEYGFNTMDIYGIPYPEFLDIADEEGLLLQIFPGDLQAGSFPVRGRQHKDVIQQAMLENINHPSIFSYGWSAEHYDNKPDFVKKLDTLYAFSKKIDPTRLVLGRGGSCLKNVGHGKSDYEELIEFRHITNNFDKLLKEKVSSPVVMHEVGWWSSYPNPALKKKYEGCAMLPFFITYAEEIARKRGMENLLPLFVENSEKLQALERRVGLEAIRKTSRVSGYYLWMGNDSVSAVEGLWDDFGDPKNVSAGEFLQCNGKTVLLMEQDFMGRDCWTVPKNDDTITPGYSEEREMQGRTLWAGEHLRLEFLLSHWDSFPARDGILTWKLTDADTGKSLNKGEVCGITAKNFALSRLQKIDVVMPEISEAKKIRFQAVLSVAEKKIRNSWDFWIFPRNLPEGRGKGIYAYNKPQWAWWAKNKNWGKAFDFEISSKKGSPWNCWPVLNSRTLADCGDARVLVSFNSFGTGLIDFMEKGGRVLLVNDDIFPSYPGSRYNSIPWHCAPAGNSGTVLSSHPCLKRFPHEGWCDLQFYDMIKSEPVNLDIWPARINPIIRSIDSYMVCRSRGVLFEVSVGKGTLMVSTLNPVDTPASRFLFSELIEYLYSGRCQPEVSVDGDFLRLFVKSN